MRTVGQVLLAIVLVTGALAGGTGGAGAAHAATSGALDGLFSSPAGVGTQADSLALFDGPSPAAPAWNPPDTDEAALSRTETVGVSDSQAAGNESLGDVRPSQSRQDIVLRQEFRLTPDRPGHVEVTHNYSVTDRVLHLESAVPRRAAVTETNGFSARNDTVYEWDAGAGAPSITYSLPVNETGSLNHASANGSLLFADVGEWALFRRPGTVTRWEARGRDPVTFERETVTAGPGAAGDWLVYLGEVKLHPRTTANQTFRLAVPAAANMTESPDDVLDAMERASADLDVGDRDDAVFAVAAPTDGVPWAVRGLSTGGADFWVGADERLATPDNIWIHEYVHTRQDYRPTAATRWTIEAFPTYYAAQQAMRHESVTFEQYAASLAHSPKGTANVTLSAPDTWGNVTEYERGALVAAQLDRRVRLASGGERSLDSIFARMNADGDRLNASEFSAAIRDVGNDAIRQRTRTATDGDLPIAMWNRSQHVAAFDGLPARFTSRLPVVGDSPGYRVTGPYRNVSVGSDEPLTVVTGESLVVNAEVENVGGKTGYFDAALRVNGSVVDTTTGRIPANESRQVPLGHTFRKPGVHTVGVGNDTATVRVRRPARGAIAGIDLSPGSISQYQNATVGVTVRNDASIPAERRVTIRRGNDTVITRSVQVGPNATKTTEVAVRFPMAGTDEVVVDDAGALQVQVEPRARPGNATAEAGANATANADGTPTGVVSGANGPAFGSLAALFALVAAALLAHRRR